MKFTSVNLLDELAKPEFSSLLSAFHERSFPKNSMILGVKTTEKALAHFSNIADAPFLQITR